MDAGMTERSFVDSRTPVEEAILHRCGRHGIDKVFVGGKLVVDDGKVVSIDRDAVLGEIADRLAQPVTPTEEQAQAMVDTLMLHLEAFHNAKTPNLYEPYRYNGVT